MARVLTLLELLVGLLVASCATQSQTVERGRASRPEFDTAAFLESTDGPFHGRLVLVRTAPDGTTLERIVLGDTQLAAETLVPSFRATGDTDFREIPKVGRKEWQMEWRGFRERWALHWISLRSCVFRLATSSLQEPVDNSVVPASSAAVCERREGVIPRGLMVETNDENGIRFRRVVLEGGARELSMWNAEERLAFLRIDASEVGDSWFSRTRRKVEFLPCGLGLRPIQPLHVQYDEADGWRTELLLFDFSESNPSPEQVKRLWKHVMTGGSYSNLLPWRPR